MIHQAGAGYLATRHALADRDENTNIATQRFKNLVGEPVVLSVSPSLLPDGPIPDDTHLISNG